MAQSDATKAAERVHEQCGGGGKKAGAYHGKRYAGITCDPERRGREHKVSADDTSWVIECSSEDVAREAEKLLHSWGYDGRHGWTQKEAAERQPSVHVYAYVITPDTIEDTNE